MRDEDLKNLPQTIERWKFAEMLASALGIADYRNVQEIRFEPRRIYVRVLATDEKGHRYFEGDEAAVHEISIPYVGEWKRPTDDLRVADQVETAAISMWQTSCIDADAEQADLEWQEMQGNWLELLTDEEREEYREQARRMLARLDLGATANMNRCSSRPVGEYAALRCEQQANHGGQHVAWNSSDSDVRWGSNSGLEDPDDAVQDCEAWEAQDGEVVQCAMPLGHDGEHSYRLHTGRVLKDKMRPAVPGPCCVGFTLSGKKYLCERSAGHSEDHAVYVDGVLHKW